MPLGIHGKSDESTLSSKCTGQMWTSLSPSMFGDSCTDSVPFHNPLRLDQETLSQNIAASTILWFSSPTPLPCNHHPLQPRYHVHAFWVLPGMYRSLSPLRVPSYHSPCSQPCNQRVVPCVRCDESRVATLSGRLHSRTTIDGPGVRCRWGCSHAENTAEGGGI